MKNETKKVCNALTGLIGKVCTDHNALPNRFSLEFGDDEIQITADINLQYDGTKKNVEEYINRILKNDKKE